MPRIGTGDAGFGQHLDDHEVYANDGFVTKPQNWNELLGMVEQSRPVPIPSESYNTKYEELCQETTKVENKNDVMRYIFPLIAGSSRFCSSRNHSFANLADLTDHNIVKLQPDIYDGADSTDLDPAILTELNSFLQPLVEKKCPVAPNFFGVFKGPKTDFFVAENQARYAGAIGARAIHKLRSFAVEGPEMMYDNNAYTITAVYHVRVGILRLYGHRPIEPSVPGGSMRYRMTLIRSFAMDDSPDAFRRGVTAFRNAREWAMRKRNECIAAANAKTQSTTTTQNTATTSVEDPSFYRSCITS